MTAVEDLLALQSAIKGDAEGYQDEFELQYRHYKSQLELLRLSPQSASRELANLVQFLAQVAHCYPSKMAGFPKELMSLLDELHAQLDGQLRKAMVQALILLKNKGLVAPADALPLLFRLFRVQDKALREHLYRHIVSDIKAQNRKHRNERLNRALQNFMYSMLADDNETAAKKSLAVLMELYRRGVWRDARTVNVIASACFHKSSSVMLAALRFFLGQDTGAEDSGEESGDDEKDSNPALSGPTKQDIYKAHNLGTAASKRKKQKKLKRVMEAAKKAHRKSQGSTQHSFAALDLLHDPQAFAEKLFARLRKATERFETRLALMQVVSRCIGAHQLLVLSFYPFMQKYLMPHQREATQVLAALVQAVHSLVPPDILAPVLRQLVDNFVHDKARPEVMTVGLKTVRELCLRQPLVMEEDLLRDLVQYKKYRDKQVGAAARGLIGLFRELDPGMLEKKDRGRGHDKERRLGEFGSGVGRAAERVPGADLLEAALRKGLRPEDIDSDDDDEDDDGDDEGGSDEGAEGAGGEGGVPSERGGGGEGESEGGESGDEGEGSDGVDVSGGEESELELGSEEGSESGESDGQGTEGASEGEADVGSGSDESDESEGEGEDGSGGSDGEGSSDGDGDRSDDEEGAGVRSETHGSAGARVPPKADSIADLKRRLAEAKKKKEGAGDAGKGSAGAGDGGGGGSGAGDGGGGSVGDGGAGLAEGVPIEWGRILTDADFAAIRKLQNRRVVQEAMAKHGMTSAKKRAASEVAAENDDELERLLRMAPERLAERRVRAEDLEARVKRRMTKEERLASVEKGREGRGEFGAASGRHKKKTGGSSNREKEKKKVLPVAARLKQIQRRKHARKYGGKVKGGTKKKR